MAEEEDSRPGSGSADESDDDGPPESGEGVFSLGPVSRYEGEWRRFGSTIKRHGQGRFTTDGFSYEGDFAEDLFHGHGILRWPEGQEYDGDFCQGQIEGEGEILFLDGSRYKGQWVAGRMHGTGTFSTLDDQHWTGEWYHGMSTCPIFPQLLPVPAEEEEEIVVEDEEIVVEKEGE
jgi:hypothetical protein